MDEAEKSAELHLRGLGYGSVTYEPDGNVSPDFLVEGEIAVEVRRLVVAVEGARGLEPVATAQVSLRRFVTEILASFGPSTGSDYWVSYRLIRRPLPKPKVLRETLSAGLAGVVLRRPDVETMIECGPNLRFLVRPAGAALKGAFRLAAMSDYQHSGWITEHGINAVTAALQAKSKTLDANRGRYPRWWLVLVDRTGMGLGQDDLDDVREHVTIEAGWEQVHILTEKGAFRWR